MLKPYQELRKIDVSAFCETRKAKDENGKQVDIQYLPWAQCLELLYDNGADVVTYEPLEAPDGSFLFTTPFETVDKNGRVGNCYFVKVKVAIDDKAYTHAYPVMNGTAVVYRDTLNQLRVSNAIQRAFVKCVAVNTGLGIGLWIKADETTEKTQTDDPFQHSPLMVKRAIEELMTLKVRNSSVPDVCQKLGITEKNYKSILQYLDNAAWLLSALQK